MKGFLLSCNSITEGENEGKTPLSILVLLYRDRNSQNRSDYRVVSDASRTFHVYRKVYGAIATRLDAVVGPPRFHTEMKLFLNH